MVVKMSDAKINYFLILLLHKHFDVSSYNGSSIQTLKVQQMSREISKACLYKLEKGANVEVQWVKP